MGCKKERKNKNQQENSEKQTKAVRRYSFPHLSSMKSLVSLP